MTLDASKLVGLLAEPDRLRVFAALVLEPDTSEGVAVRTGLDQRAVTASLERLVGSGLAARGGDGKIAVVDGHFKAAARQAAPRDDGAEGSDDQRLLARLVVDGRIVHIPAKLGKKLVLLDWLAQRFEPGQRYPERQVNELLLQAHADYASLRRLLVDTGFLDRSGGEYWRCGGTVAGA